MKLKLLLIHLRRRLLAGIATIVPFAITIGVVYMIFRWVKRFLIPQVGTLIHIENQEILLLISIVTVVALIYLLGLLSSFILGRRLIKLGELLFTHIPLVRFIYLTSKQIVDTLAMPERTALQKVVVIEFPRKGSYALAFATGELNLSTTDLPRVTVFLPTTPNPTSGFMLVLPSDEVYETNLTVEQGIKMIISGGIVVPERLELRPYQPTKRLPTYPLDSLSR